MLKIDLAILTPPFKIALNVSVFIFSKPPFLLITYYHKKVYF